MFRTEQINEDTVIIFPGRSLDNSNAHEITNLLSKIQRDGLRYAIIDMKELEFLSSAGVGSILGVLGGFRDAGGDIVLCNVGERILHILEILDLRDFLTIEQNEESAKNYCLTRD